MLPDLRPSAVTSPAVGNPAPVRLGPPNRSSLLPGLAVAAAITTLALAINQWQPLLSALLLAIVVGAVVGNVRLTGGQGSIFVAGDGSNQTIVLGMNDPMVSGGGKAATLFDAKPTATRSKRKAGGQGHQGEGGRPHA